MLSSRWRKVFNDLWGDKLRTLLIVLSIAVGLFAVGTILSARTILSTEMAESYARINPSDGTVRTLQPFDEDFVRSVRAMPNVAEADARRVIQARVQVGEGKWANLQIFAIQDYNDMRVNIVRPQSGAWPPPEREILIERAALSVINAQEGDVILVETPDQKLRAMRIAGTAHDLAQLPAWADNSPYGYISFETLEWFGEPYGFNELHVIAEKSNLPKTSNYAQQVVNQVKDKAEKSGLTIPMSMAAEPGQIPLDDILQAILLLMGVIGSFSLALSAFLIVNTVSALLAQQKRQIGVMKALGARTSQLLGMYLSMTLIYGLLALALSLPLSAVGARALSDFMAAMFNFDLAESEVPSGALLLQVIVGLLVPMLASLYPFLVNLRLTAAEAMSAYYQVGKGRFGKNPIDRLLSGANLWFARRLLMRPLLLSIRNTFRSKGRLALTLITLSMASATFISVFNVRASLFRTVDDLLAMWNFDAMVTFERPYRFEKIAAEAGRVQGVAQTDAWIQVPARRVRPNGDEGKMVYMFATRPASELARSPVIVQGRWLLPEDENAVVICSITLQDEPDLAVGDEITLKVNGRERVWRIVGVSKGFMIPMIYANYDYVAGLTGRTGRADTALIATEQQDTETVARTSAQLEDHFEYHGMHVSSIQTLAAERGEASVVFGIVISLMLVMAVLLALVGGLGLMGMMSINVLERRREIGVLRAIGAPNRGVARVFIMEGITVGLISWLAGALLAHPLSKLLGDAVGMAMAGAPLNFSFSMTGVWLWLLIVTALSALASAIPARNASRLTVREVLAYE
ncbi:MAG: ABC transporter permease [Anaerolineales bacterium]|nr:ABC transporter permease [Anaerolineales bacterium]